MVSDKVPLVLQKCLVLWGRNDEILEPSTADKFEQLLPNGRVRYYPFACCYLHPIYCP